jgi:hypothetical protein
MPLPISIPQTPENNGSFFTEKSLDDTYSNTTTPILIFDKDIPLGSLLTARCCFGTASSDDTIYVVGMC